MRKILLVLVMMVSSGSATAGWIIGVDSLSTYESKIKTELKITNEDKTLLSSNDEWDGNIQRGLGYHIGYRYDLVQIRFAYRAWSGTGSTDDYSFTSFALGTYRDYQTSLINWQWDVSLGLGKHQNEETSYRVPDTHVQLKPKIGFFAEANAGFEIYPNVVLNLGYFMAILEDEVDGIQNIRGVNYIWTGKIKNEVKGLHIGVNYQF